MELIKLITGEGKPVFHNSQNINFKHDVKRLTCGQEVKLSGGIKARLFVDPFDQTIGPELRIKVPGKQQLFFSFKDQKTISLLDHAGCVISLVAYSEKEGRPHAMWFVFSEHNAKTSKCRRG